MTKVNNYPIEDCAKAVQPYVDAGCHFNQKFTCAKCGTRQTMAKADTWFKTGNCEECDYLTDITQTGCNYLLHGRFDIIDRVRREQLKTPHVIRVVAFANGIPCPIAGQWLKSFDFNAHSGRGSGEFVADWRKAKEFESQADALAYWNTVSTVRPIREDSRPNKPLTATTCEIETLAQARRWEQSQKRNR
jgi:hypothetical protein